MSPAKSASHSVSLQLQNQTAEIARMSHWLKSILDDWYISPTLQFRVDLAANEAVTNILSYAFPNGGEHRILLNLSLENDRLKLSIEDDGIDFNPLEMPPHKQPKSIAEAEIGGLGIHLIRHYMDECDYQRHNGKNHLILSMYVSAATK
ncbi:MAG: ATP-binding protein [Methylophaga sp.]|nr:ATP-binding protein [Methylophaga sp.]